MHSSSSGQFVINGVDFEDQVFEQLANDRAIELANAENDQIQVMEALKKKAGGAQIQVRNMKFGRLRFKVAKSVYDFWGTKLGYECWKDEDFKNYMEKRFSNLMKIKSISDKLVVGT
tara:strand:- start:210 stop:560 length:351 start_codon:yes stop_codon:yes gene_type:complete